MAVYKIRKRNGTIITFDRLRIEAAIAKAIEAVGGTDYSGVVIMTDNTLQSIQASHPHTIPTVESVQDAIEETLIKAGHDTVAKAYILYRKKREESRDASAVMVEV